MATYTWNGLIITVEGARVGDLKRGLAAAHRIMMDGGVKPLEGALAAFKYEGWDISDGDPAYRLNEAEKRAAHLWWKAQTDGLAECCAGMPKVPPGATLDLELNDG